VKSHEIPFWWLVLAALLLNILAQAIHEGGHWVVYQIAGCRPEWGFTSLVQMWDTAPQHPDGWVATTAPDGERGWLKLGSAPSPAVEDLSLAAGPLASLACVLAGLLTYRLGRRTPMRAGGLILAISTAFIMTTYYARGGMRSGGDEGILAASLGIPKIAFDAPLGTAFAACLLFGLWMLKTWKERMRWFGAILLGIVPSGGLMVLADPLIRAGVDEGNPLFQPVMGFSLPVVVVCCVAIMGLVLLGAVQERRAALQSGEEPGSVVVD
jgi:hypothetical protein